MKHSHISSPLLLNVPKQDLLHCICNVRNVGIRAWHGSHHLRLINAHKETHKAGVGALRDGEQKQRRGQCSGAVTKQRVWARRVRNCTCGEL